MKPAAIAIVVAVCLVGGCLYTHRRVISAAIKGEPMPKAPSWHTWVKPEDGRG